MSGGPSSRSEEYALACEVSAAITSSLVLEDVMATVARRIAEALDVWECDLYEYYPVSETMIATACWAREMTPEDVDWVGTRVDVKERRSYQDMFRDRTFCESYAGDETDAVGRRPHGRVGGEGDDLASRWSSRGRRSAVSPWSRSAR